MADAGVSRDRVLGVLSVGARREHAFTDDDVSFLGDVAKQVAIAVENAIAYDKIATLKDKLAQEKVYLEDELRSELNFEEIVGSSDALRHLLRHVETIAPTASTGLIYGETGTGKELIAPALHTLGTRKDHAFVKLNCAAIPTGLLGANCLGTNAAHSPVQSVKAFTAPISKRARSRRP